MPYSKWTDRVYNPHVLQCTAPKVGFPFVRSLTDDFPSAAYRRRANEAKTVVHWGQRKLLMSEIEFLLIADAPSAVVVYAGAAPGTHVKVLSTLFPSCLFVLVDPAPFTVEPSENIVLKRAMFTDELAVKLRKKYRGRIILFVSDVRSCDPDVDGNDKAEACVQSDMADQARWHEAIGAFKSLLKFRLPYSGGQTLYLAGDVRLPVWGPVTTTECRLIVDANADWLVYDHVKHEEQMFFFNTVARTSLFEHMVRAEGIDHCYDCASEIQILKRYLRSIGHGKRGLNHKVARLSEDISASLSVYRTLASPNPDPGVRNQVIRRNQWVDGKPAYRVA